ncbi:hypothetical protein BCT47_00305 [Vibrio splendidus]|uniref:Restriction endonuclease type IV Mrr domain-containing protein n=1 Tax=Vibrio splendidus TaxID=29497 RepID=A0AB35MWJ0_VIBSP|nr:hypothetical protein [Vibrio splendidus]MDP2500736.1 hypothetical protein [Vibrio splendidus]PMM77910.1 hypothetical protein BCT47_00305 [Vibrio splendidus]
MQNKIGIVKNPLSVIAIFAGIAEISGTMVLPHISPENQETFIWFLMTFPFSLVVLFFITLNWNYKVLYAPSDFKDEEHFVRLTKATQSDLINKFNEDFSDSIDDSKGDIATETLGFHISSKDVERFVGDSVMKASTGKIRTKEERLKHKEIRRSISKLQLAESYLMADMVLNKIESKLGQVIERDMVFEKGGQRFPFDGVIKNGENITAIEVKVFNKNTLNADGWNRFVSRFDSFYSSLSDTEKKGFSLVLGFATEEPTEEMKNMLERRLANAKFNYFLEIYQVDELTREHNRTAS